MHALCTKENLTKVLEIAVRISARHHSLPILQAVCIEAKNSTLEIRATNLEIGLIATISAEVKEEGVVAVSAQTLLQTLTIALAATVTLQTKNDVLLVDLLNAHSELKTYASDDFPTINQISNTGIKVDGGLFSSGIKNVVFAASTSSIKPELGAVYIYQKKPHTLTLVATDSFRLAERQIPMNSFTLDHSLLVPQKNALEIARTIDLLNESPLLHITENQIAFSFPCGVYLVSRLIEGNFPDYEQIIPKEYQTYVTALLKDFERGLRSTNIFANKFMQVSLDVKPESHTLTLRAENTDSGRAEETLHVEGNGADLLLSFNQHYLMEALPHFTTDSIDFSLAGIGRPLVIKGKADENFRYLVMPMNK